MILVEIFIEFFKIGLFAIGGGMATIPFLRHLSLSKGWFSVSFIADMVAISESTPGPIGINMATYAGFNVAGVLGGIVATLGMIFPSLLIVLVVALYLEQFSHSVVLSDAFTGLRPAVTALIAVAGVELISISIMQIDLWQQTMQFFDLFNLSKMLLFGIMLFSIKRFKRHPIVYVAASAVIGIVLKL
jgi:chromate transporter